MTDYLTLEEHEAGRATVYVAEHVNIVSMRRLLTDVAAMLDAGTVKTLAAALDKAGEGIDTGDKFVCRYDVRQAVGRRCARAASALAEEGKPRTAKTIVARALYVLGSAQSVPAVAAAQLEAVA